MKTVGALVEQARAREGTAFAAPGRSTGYSTREFCTATWKAGNVLRHYGVRTGSTVAVDVDPGEHADHARVGRLGATPEPLFAALGALCLGARVDVEPGTTVEAVALVAPAWRLDAFHTAPGCTRLAYGNTPEDPTVAQFERERWSENPVAPPGDVEAAAEAMGGLTQSDLLERARMAVDATDLADGDRVRTAGRLTAAAFPGAVLAPLCAGGIIVGGDGSTTVVVEEDGGVRLTG